MRKPKKENQPFQIFVMVHFPINLFKTKLNFNFNKSTNLNILFNINTSVPLVLVNIFVLLNQLIIACMEEAQTKV